MMPTEKAVPYKEDTAPMRAVRAGSRVLENSCAILLIAMLCLSFCLVILRYIFSIGFAGAGEVMRYLFVYSTAIGASVAVLRGDHIRINVFVDMLPSGLAVAVDRLRHLLVFVCNGVFAWLSVDWIAQVGNYHTPALDVPNWVVQISVPVGMMLVMATTLSVFVFGERRMSGHKEVQEADI